jgi:hypothetical protein
MRIVIILLTILLNIVMFVGSSAQEMPLVYEVENTGADCPVPYLPAFNELPNVENLPDPFEWSDGRGRISNFSDWRYRRAEIAAEIQYYEIGEKPVRPDSITASYADNVLTVNITVNGEILTLTSQIIPPEGEGPFPAIIGMGFGTSLPDSLLSNRGIMQIPFNFGQVMAWQQIRGSEPINALYPDLTYMGAYSAWSWGVSRLIDGLELVAEDLKIDMEHIAVSGCSFAGKMAIFAGAFDERIALTIGIESGGGGYTTWRYSEVIPENVETLGNTSHVWFIEDMFQFSDAVSKLPMDHHELMAMVAPRALFVTGNPGWTWLADESGYVGSNATQKVYDALGIPDRFGYSQIGGHDHCAIPPDQGPEIEAFLDKFLLGIDTVNTDVSTSPYTTDLSPWITWSAPTLSNDSSFFGKTSLVYPANLQTGVDSSTTLKWNKSEDAAEYIVQITGDPTFKNITISESTTDTVKTISDLLEGKRYYWRVQVKNGAGSYGPWSDQWNFTTFIPAPPMPELNSVIPFPDRQGWYTFTWNKTPYADRYIFQISRLETFSPLVIPTVTSSDTVEVVSGLLEAQKYYWRVQGENIGGSGPWSLSDFTTILYAPENLYLKISASTEITLTWEDNSKKEDGYVIERKQSPQTSFTIIDTLIGSGSKYLDTSVEQGQTYAYRIKAYMDSLESDYSNEASITVVSIQEEKEIPTEYSLNQNYPNPFNPTTKIKFALPKTSSTKIIVYDLLGREIQTLINQKLEAGYHEINFDAYNLPGGIYFFRIQSGYFTQAKKMILMK